MFCEHATATGCTGRSAAIPAASPPFFLHGGPGWGCLPVMRRHFDPDRYRIARKWLFQALPGGVASQLIRAEP
jgi:hypothetical protein